MIKKMELEFGGSCLNKTADDEPIFVLRAKDAAAPVTILMWIEARILAGLNTSDDEKIKEAREVIASMNAYRIKTYCK